MSCILTGMQASPSLSLDERPGWSSPQSSEVSEPSAPWARSAQSLFYSASARTVKLADWRKKPEDIAAMMDAEYEAIRPKIRGPYKKRTA